MWIRDDFDFEFAVWTGFKANSFPKMKKLTFRYFYDFCDLVEEDISEWNVLLNQVETFWITLKEKCENAIQYTMSNVTQLAILNFFHETVKDFLQMITFPKLETLIIFYHQVEDTEFQQLFETTLNFTQIKTLFIAEFFQLDTDEFDLIMRKCPNLEYLGFCLNDLEHNIMPETIAKNIFNQWPSSENLYFVNLSLDDHHIQTVSFHRKNFGFEKSNKYCRLFDDIKKCILIIDRSLLISYWLIAVKFKKN